MCVYIYIYIYYSSHICLVREIKIYRSSDTGVYMYIGMYVCVYMYIYIYIYVCIYIYIYILWFDLGPDMFLRYVICVRHQHMSVIQPCSARARKMRPGAPVISHMIWA